MTQVLKVGQFGGKYEFLDKDGRVIDTTNDSGIISSEDADVLLERIRQGYQYISAGSYILRLEMAGAQYDTSYFEFTEMITFDYDDDGYPVPQHTRLVTQEEFDSPFSNHDRILTSNAFIDYEAQQVTWMGNALADEPYVCDPDKAVRVCDVNDDAAILLTVGGRYLMREKPVHCSLIPVRFNMG